MESFFVGGLNIFERMKSKMQYFFQFFNFFRILSSIEFFFIITLNIFFKKNIVKIKI